MRILLLSQFFDPEPMPKGMLYAKALRELGHEVQVLTGYPNYPEGKIYPGFKQRLFTKTTIDGIEIIRVPLYPSHDRSALRRIANYVSFALTSAFIGGVLIKRPDVIYAYHPPGTISFSALFIKLLTGAPVILDIQDLWPDTLASTGMVRFPIIIFLVSLWMKLTYRFVDKIVVLSPGFKSKLLLRGVPAEKISIIYNWADEANLLGATKSDSLRTKMGISPDTFVVLFAGTMGLAQGLDAVLRAAVILNTSAKNILIVFLGGGLLKDKLEENSKQLGLSNVRFLPKVSMDKMPEYYGIADALLVHLRDDPLFTITIPSKTQAYMAAGVPIIMGVRGDAAEIVKNAACGEVVTPEDPDALSEIIVHLSKLDPKARREMGLKGREYYQQHLSLASGVKKFVEVFKQSVR